MRNMIVFVLVAAALATAGDGKAPEPKKNAQFDQMKKLVGEWLIVGEDGKPSKDIGVVYRLSAGGSALVETIFPGSEHEMVTVFYVDGEDLVLTHYCMLGNQPHMKADPKSAAGTIQFQFAGGSNIDATKDMHMHDALFTFVDNDHLKTSWTMWANGKAGDAHGFAFVRKPKA